MRVNSSWLLFKMSNFERKSKRAKEQKSKRANSWPCWGNKLTSFLTTLFYFFIYSPSRPSIVLLFCSGLTVRSAAPQIAMWGGQHLVQSCEEIFLLSRSLKNYLNLHIKTNCVRVGADTLVSGWARYIECKQKPNIYSNPDRLGFYKEIIDYVIMILFFFKRLFILQWLWKDTDMISFFVLIYIYIKNWLLRGNTFIDFCFFYRNSWEADFFIFQNGYLKIFVCNWETYKYHSFIYCC